SLHDALPIWLGLRDVQGALPDELSTAALAMLRIRKLANASPRAHEGRAVASGPRPSVRCGSAHPTVARPASRPIGPADACATPSTPCDALGSALTEELEIFGLPRCEFEIRADKPVAQLAVRLSDVNESGEATRDTYGVLNLTHRDGR